MTNALFDGLLMVVSLAGAFRFFALRDRPGLDFACGALLIVAAAALLGTIRYAGVTPPMLVVAHETVSTMAGILAPSWAIAAIVILLRGEPGRVAHAVLWLVPAIIVPLGVAEPTAAVGSIYAQMASLVMLVMMLAAGIVLALRSHVMAGAGLAVGAAGYAVAALSTLGFFGLGPSDALNLFHGGVTIWAAGLSIGLMAADAVKQRDLAHSQ